MRPRGLVCNGWLALVVAHRHQLQGFPSLHRRWRLFDSAGDTMKLLRFLGALLAIAVVSVVWSAAVPSVVNAQAACTDRVPWAALAGSVISSAHADGQVAVQPSSWSFAVAPVGAGGATLAGSTTAASVGTGAAGVAAFLLASAGTCAALDLQIGGVSIGGFLDAVLGDTLQLPATTPTSSIVVDTPTACSGFSSSYPGTNISGWGMCRAVFLPAPVTGTSLGWYSNFSEQIRSGVVLSTYLAPRSFKVPGVAARAELADYRDGMMNVVSGEYGCERNAITGGAQCQANTWPATGKPILMRYRCGDFTAVTSFNPADVRNIGSSCGQPPGQLYGLSGTSTSDTFRAFVNLWPEVNVKGWERRWVVSVKCRAASGTAVVWKKVESAKFWDYKPDVRIPVPECAAGELPVSFTVAKVPVGITCGAVYQPGCTEWEASSQFVSSNWWTVYEWTSPSSWTNSATAPAHTTCLLGGASCAPPAVVSGTCTWGGGSIAGGCTPAEQTAASTVVDVVATLPELAPTTGGLVDQSNPPLAVPVVVPPTVPPGGGVTVNIPIDDGGGECSGRAGCIAVNAPIGNGDESECWLTGWGWFNPAEWVLRPIRCGMRWAFVPSGTQVQDSWSALTAEANSAVPVAWIVNGADLMHDVVDGLDAGIIANESQCVTWMPTGLEGASGNAGRVCLQAALAGTAWGPWRGRVGVAVFIMWAFLLVGTALSIIGGTREAKTESFYVNHDY